MEANVRVCFILDPQVLRMLLMLVLSLKLEDLFIPVLLVLFLMGLLQYSMGMNLYPIQLRYRFLFVTGDRCVFGLHAPVITPNSTGFGPLF